MKQNWGTMLEIFEASLLLFKISGLGMFRVTCRVEGFNFKGLTL